MPTNDPRPGALARTTRPDPRTTRPTPTAKQRREQARQDARARRAAHERAARRQRLLLRGLVAALVVGVVALVGLTVWRYQNPTDSPLHPDAQPALADVALPSTADATGGIPVSAGGVGERAEAGVTVDVWLDFMCPVCAVLERTNGADLAELAAQPGVTVVYHPVSILDGKSQGSSYSTRAANVAGVVADRDPDRFVALVTELFAPGVQPEELTSGLDDDELAAVAERVGVPADVVEGFTTRTDEAGRTFAGWAAASVSTIPLDELGRRGTPRITIDGAVWSGDFSAPGALRAAVEQAMR